MTKRRVQKNKANNDLQNTTQKTYDFDLCCLAKVCISDLIVIVLALSPGRVKLTTIKLLFATNFWNTWNLAKFYEKHKWNNNREGKKIRFLKSNLSVVGWWKKNQNVFITWFRVRELTTAKIGTLLKITGQVVRTHPIHPELVSGTFMCLDCRTIIKDVEQQFKYTQVCIVYLSKSVPMDKIWQGPSS
jgi:hypothetical protein